MSLDISAYSNVQFVSDGDGEDLDLSGLVYIGENCAAFADRCSLKRGYYAYDSEFDHFCLSYGGYGVFRNELARLAGYKPVLTLGRDGKKEMRYDKGAWEKDGGLLWELINFTDCNGVLGANVCKKLLGDFEQIDVESFESKIPYFRAKYDQIVESIRIGANNGAVVFS